MILFIILIIFLNILSSPIISYNVTDHFEDSIDQSDVTFPSSFSWCDINGVDYSTPIKNQAPCPTCEAYAVVAALETLVQYQVGYPFGCDLSEIHLFFCSGGDANWGVNVQNCANYLVDYGVPDEGCSPEPHRSFETPCSETLPGWENRTVKISEWGWVENDIDSIKNALIEYGPLIICMVVYTDLYYYRSGIYRSTWGDREGGHLITIFGYNDDQRYWLIKNSWGVDWGEDGWVRVSYDAHSDERPFFRAFYGGTGILYIDGIYGNLQPEAPKIYIEKPIRGLTYFNNLSWKYSFLRKIFIQRGEAIIIKGTTIEIDTSDDTEYVEVYIDEVLKYNITSPPFRYYLNCDTYGLHELKVMAYNDKKNASMDIIDIFTIPIPLNLR